MMLRQQSFVNDSTAMLFYLIVVSATNLLVQGVNNGPQNSNTIGSPCPSVFQYNWDGLDWYGIIIAPSLPYGTPARLLTRLSIGRVLPTKYAGSLELIGPRADVLHAMLTEQPIRYRVNFPLPHPLPLVTAITLNDRLICSGPTVAGPIVTSITLEHTLYPHGQTLNSRGRLPPFGLNDQQQQQENTFIPNNNDDNNGGSNDDHQLINNNRNNNNIRQINSNTNGNGAPSFIDDATIFDVNNNEQNVPTNSFDNTSDNSFNGSATANNKGMKAIERNILADICGTAVHITPLVANGEVTKRGSHPWLVALFAQKSLGLEFSCGGTLISSRYVITAAHCIRYGENRALTAEEVVVVLGKYRIRRWTERGTVVRDASRIILHPDYRALSGDADLAAIELEEPVTFTDTIRPVCIWLQSSVLSQGSPRAFISDDLVGVEGIIVGWGRDETGLKVTPEPRQVLVRVVSQEDCLRSRLEFRYITSNRTICAGGVSAGSGPCSGDSGGGLFVPNDKDGGKWYLRGVISMSLADPTTKSCDLNHFSVFVDISKFTDWIEQFIN